MSSITNNVDLNINSSLSDSQEQTISNIKNLQQIETDLYNSLENSLSTNSLSNEEKENIINKINEVSVMRTNLFNSLTTSYSFYETNLTTSQNVLNDQIIALNAVNSQLNSLKNKMKLIIEKNTNKRRLIEINTYYSKEYNAYSQVMKYILFICVPILILSILSNKNILPDNIYNLLVIIILVVGIIVIIRKLWDIAIRDSINFDEYNWHFNPSDYTSSTSTSSSSNSSSSTTTTTTSPCVGAACCSTTQLYDDTLNLCVPIPTSSSSQTIMPDDGTTFVATTSSTTNVSSSTS